MKKFWAGGARPSRPPLRSATDNRHRSQFIHVNQRILCKMESSQKLHSLHTTKYYPFWVSFWEWHCYWLKFTSWLLWIHTGIKPVWNNYTVPRSIIFSALNFNYQADSLYCSKKVLLWEIHSHYLNKNHLLTDSLESAIGCFQIIDCDYLQCFIFLNITDSPPPLKKNTHNCFQFEYIAVRSVKSFRPPYQTLHRENMH